MTAGAMTRVGEWLRGGDGEPGAGGERVPLGLRWTTWAQRYGMLAALVILFAYNAAETPFFLTRQSLLFVLLRQAAPVAIVAVGMAIVIGTGGIDLSVGCSSSTAGASCPRWCAR
jgi:ribose/xylose/arabinose/galactoside ABC-type transport system permease subunit